jgi:hypothetical protein
VGDGSRRDGMDLHKRSVPIEARDARDVLRETGTFPTSTAGCRALVGVVRQWPRPGRATTLPTRDAHRRDQRLTVGTYRPDGPVLR